MGLLNAFKENKRKRVELKVEQKWEIIEYRKKFLNLSQVQLIVHFNRKFETVISKQAMSDMLKRDYEKKLEKINSVEDYNTRIRQKLIIEKLL
jgi:predicted nucleotidyltransferase